MATLLSPNINFNSKQSTIIRSGIFLPRNRLIYNHNLPLRSRLIKALKDDNITVKDRENAVINGNVRLNGNGSVRLNGNGRLVKYVNGSVTEEVSQKRKEEVRKKRVEDIGQEDAWFKKTQQNQVEVSVAPGGRWSRFKTYSTIQRTLEIWGFVLKFIFRTWLSNQKFSYKGCSF